MRRVAAVLALSLCAAVPALAQDRTTLPLVAMLRVNTPDTVEPGATMFRTALAALGHVDGRDIRLEVDGGIKVDNIRAAADAGCDTFVAGSAIFGEKDYRKVIDAMRSQLAG